MAVQSNVTLALKLCYATKWCHSQEIYQYLSTVLLQTCHNISIPNLSRLKLATNPKCYFYLSDFYKSGTSKRETNIKFHLLSL